MVEVKPEFEGIIDGIFAPILDRVIGWGFTALKVWVLGMVVVVVVCGLIYLRYRWRLRRVMRVTEDRELQAELFLLEASKPWG